MFINVKVEGENSTTKEMCISTYDNDCMYINQKKTIQITCLVFSVMVTDDINRIINPISTPGKAVCISLCANALEKGITPSALSLPSVMGK